MNRATPKYQCGEPGSIQSNRQPFHEYAEVQDSSEVTKSDKVVRWHSSSHNAAMSSSMPSPKASLQHAIRQPGRKTNPYSELDKKVSYSILEPHMQEKTFSFKKESEEGNANYNVLDY